MRWCWMASSFRFRFVANENDIQNSTAMSNCAVQAVIWWVPGRVRWRVCSRSWRGHSGCSQVRPSRSGRASNLTTAPNVFVSGGLQPWKARYDSRCLTWEAPGSEVLSLTSALLTHLTSRLKPVVLQNV